LKSELLQAKIANRLKIEDYHVALDASNEILLMGATRLGDKTFGNISNVAKLWRVLKDQPSQKITIVKEFECPLNEWTVPVSVQDSTYDFILDTGANFSIIGATYAKKLGLVEIEADVDMGATSGFVNKADVGILPLFKIGDIEIRNAVFLILSDQSLTFDDGFFIKGVIGFPIINALKEIRIRNGNTLVVPKEQSNDNLGNLAMEGLFPIINMEVNGDSLLFTFDTGANTTTLSYAYYKRYEDFLERNAKRVTGHVTGIGGRVEREQFELPIFFRTGETEIKLDSVRVYKEVFLDHEKYFFGNLGVDLINQCDEVIINFDRMFVKFIK
jgi:predicted aspartyl protease